MGDVAKRIHDQASEDVDPTNVREPDYETRVRTLRLMMYMDIRTRKSYALFLSFVPHLSDENEGCLC